MIPRSAVSDSKWRVKFTLADASGAVLGVLALKAAELELNPKDPEWFNLEGSAAARISVIVQQREAMCDPVPLRDPRPRRSLPSPVQWQGVFQPDVGAEEEPPPLEPQPHAAIGRQRQARAPPEQSKYVLVATSV